MLCCSLHPSPELYLERNDIAVNDGGRLLYVDESLAITEQLLNEIADQLPELQPQ
jgi:hypothetical protein